MRILRLLKLVPQLVAEFDDALDWQLAPADGSTSACDTLCATAGAPGMG